MECRRLFQRGRNNPQSPCQPSHRCSQNQSYYGENKDADVWQTRRIAYFTAFVISAVCAVAGFLARTKIGLLFGASASANADVGRYLPFFLATVLLLSFVRITTSYFYATEKAALSYL